MRSRDVEFTINQETAMKNLTTLVAIATFAAGILTAAQANADSERYTQTVRFADLNTTNAGDTTLLYHRVVLAAHGVCSDLDVTASVAATMRFARCWQSAVKNAVAKINLPTLTAYAAARGLVPADAAIQIARSN
jgi:UrcA family protein